MLIGVAAAIGSPTVAPVNIDPPTITGTARVGEVLTARNGTWDNAPTSYRYRWLRCNQTATRACCSRLMAQTYRLGQADVGRTLRVRVTAVNADGATHCPLRADGGRRARTPHRSRTLRDRRSPVKRASAKSSLPARGRGRATRPSFSFQWQRCNIDAITCLDVTGATGRTYGVRIADLGFRLRVQVDGSQGRPLGYCDLEPDGGRRADDAGHERATDASHPQGHVPGSEDLRALPRLRRPAAESRHPGSRDAPWSASGTQALCHSCRAASVRCLHAKLASGAALPRSWSIHDHAASAGLLGQNEPAGRAHVPSIAIGDWHHSGGRVVPFALSLR